ncbi:unnamed protein product, partial [Polarella glacialis]
ADGPASISAADAASPAAFSVGSAPRGSRGAKGPLRQRAKAAPPAVPLGFPEEAPAPHGPANADSPDESLGSAAWSGVRFSPVEACLQEARRHLADQQLPAALRACLPVLDGPASAVEMIRLCITSWEQEERKLVVRHEGETNSLTCKFMAARDRADKLNDQKAAKDLEILKERRLRIEAENRAALLRQRHNEVVQENYFLQQQLRRAEQQKARQPPTREEVVRQLAKFECAPLQECDHQDRASLKKKLLLKWHPDKQPSCTHASLATQVMQELQNRAEWSW